MSLIGLQRGRFVVQYPLVTPSRPYCLLSPYPHALNFIQPTGSTEKARGRGTGGCDKELPFACFLERELLRVPRGRRDRRGAEVRIQAELFDTRSGINHLADGSAQLAPGGLVQDFCLLVVILAHFDSRECPLADVSVLDQ